MFQECYFWQKLVRMKARFLASLFAMFCFNCKVPIQILSTVSHEYIEEGIGASKGLNYKIEFIALKSSKKLVVRNLHVQGVELDTELRDSSGESAKEFDKGDTLTMHATLIADKAKDFGLYNPSYTHIILD